jgi:hypothetical protein
VHDADMRWLHFQFWLKAFDIALSPLASSAMTIACVTKSAPGPPHSFGTASVRNPSFEPLTMMSPVPRLEAAFDLVALDRQRTDLFLRELARFLLPVALLFVE